MSRHAHDYNAANGNNEPSGPSSPTDPQIVLLCLDYLRNLRRDHHEKDELLLRQGIQEDYITLAIWALAKSFASPTELVVDNDSSIGAGSGSVKPWQYGNDAHFQHEFSNSNFKMNKSPHTKSIGKLTHRISIPPLEQMEDEILYKKDPHLLAGKIKADASSLRDCSSWYEYDDLHYSNQHRFYKFDGLDSIPVSLQEVVSSGFDTMRGRSRIQGEEIMMKDAMFTDFMDAVKAKAYFQISEKDVLNRSGTGMLTSKPKVNAVKEQIYLERYRKVVSKFRNKLVEKALEEEEDRAEEERNEAFEDNEDRLMARKGQNQAKMKMIVPEKSPLSQDLERDVCDDEATVTGSVVGAMEMAKESGYLHFDDAVHKKPRPSMSRMSMTSTVSRKDVEEAEKLKVMGNSSMQQKKYEQAKNYYTKALELAPSGPTSHVYYSNRSAALLSMRNFTEAVWDAERSIALKPDYAKAHARLGLAHFLLGQYKDAVDSYTLAVEYEPRNQTSLSYLERSKKKLNMGDDEASVSSNISRSSKSARRKSVLTSRRASVATTSEFGAPDRDTLPVKKASSSRRLGEERRHTARGEDEDEENYDPTLEPTSSLKLEEADFLKVEGNKAMARKEYSEAVKLYSKALRLAPAGPSSHVYFSNRAAALCYLERYEEAELDSERALALDPEFGKAHARLGLSRYFLKDYHGAVEAYETAAAYEPGNESNRIYLAKAKLKLGRRQSTANNGRV